MREIGNRREQKRYGKGEEEGDGGGFQTIAESV